MNSEARKRAHQPGALTVTVDVVDDPRMGKVVLLQLPDGYVVTKSEDARRIAAALIECADRAEQADLVEEGRRFASEREDLIAQGVDPADLLVPEVPVVVQPCPECRAGKHGNCDGGSWDYVADEPAACPCAIEDHEGGA
ncbi:hypothetical protein ACFFOS_27520 [Nocardioides kongjuensis]|uniref:Uncharacterized protein n=1 Tax=Nocardioides kongjuensis TaxID=349522 RepID=A0A852RFJ0_9ACTN|nr:hypothetical protein [Nocardioides kongjuensis]NYD33873.1 hypothetical protein [Nocardioides kongjuensis]